MGRIPLKLNAFFTKNAICVINPGPRIDVQVQTPHGELVFGDHVYFTAVDLPAFRGKR